MDKINLVSTIVKLSLKFDDALKNNKFCDLQKISDNIKLCIRKLKITSSDTLDTEIDKLCEKIIEVNEYAINHIMKLKNNKQTENILIFFYTENCQPSIDFVPEWKKLMTNLNGKVHLISVNCGKYKSICKDFNIYEYPTVKYITPTKVHQYFGTMKAEDIMEEFLLN